MIEVLGSVASFVSVGLALYVLIRERKLERREESLEARETRMEQEFAYPVRFVSEDPGEEELRYE